MHSLFFLKTPVLQSEWIDGHPAFESADGGIVRAYMQMLFAAVRAPVGGVLPSSSGALAAICGIPEERVIGSWDVLTHSWVLTPDGCLQHPGVANYCKEINARYETEIAGIHQQISDLDAALQMGLDGCGAELGAAPKKVTKRPLGKRLMPKDFGLTPELCDWLANERGVTSAFHQRYLMEQFQDYARAKAPQYVEWNAAFRNNVDMVLRTRGLPDETPAPQFQPAYGGRPVFGGSKSRPAAQQDLVRSEACGVFARAQERAVARGSFNA